MIVNFFGKYFGNNIWLFNVFLGLLESPKIPHAESLHLAQMMDELRRQVGVVYAEDKE